MNNINPLYGMMPYYEPNYIPSYMNNNMGNNNIITNSDITTPQVGFIKGNMFDNLYVPYKNYKPLIPEVNNEKEKLLNSIRELSFTLTDLDLYLDTHSNNTSVIDLYGKYLKEKDNLINNYESKYGPLNLNSKYQNMNSWAWALESWPWEVES